MRLFGCGLLLVLLLIAGCNANPASTLPYDDVPQNGDVTRGEALFSQQNGIAPACSSCHTENSSAVPNLAGYGAIAGTRVEGESAHEYTFYAIAEPGRFVVEGYGNAMYNKYDEALSPQDFADLIAYMLGL